MQIFPTRLSNVTAWRHSRLRVHWLMAVVGGRGWRRSMYSAFPGNCSVSYLSFVYGRSLWAELNGRENSLHWKANMLPLFSIMTLWTIVTKRVIISWMDLEFLLLLQSTKTERRNRWGTPVLDCHCSCLSGNRALLLEEPRGLLNRSANETRFYYLFKR